MKKDLNNKEHHPLDDLRAPDGCIYMNDDMSFYTTHKLVKTSRSDLKYLNEEDIARLVASGVEIVDGPVAEDEAYILIEK